MRPFDHPPPSDRMKEAKQALALLKASVRDAEAKICEMAVAEAPFQPGDLIYNDRGTPFQVAEVMGTVYGWAWPRVVSKNRDGQWGKQKKTMVNFYMAPP